MNRTQRQLAHNVQATSMLIIGDHDRATLSAEFDSGFSSFPQQLRAYAREALAAGNEVYIYTYDRDTRSDILRSIGRHASNDELNFTWPDAAEIGKTIRYAGEPVE